MSNWVLLRYLQHQTHGSPQFPVRRDYMLQRLKYDTELRTEVSRVINHNECTTAQRVDLVALLLEA